jgi:hypothetical protein
MTTVATCLDHAVEIQTHILTRGYDVAFTEAQVRALVMIRGKLAVLEAQLSMNARIQQMLKEHQAALRAALDTYGWTAALAHDWTVLQRAWEAIAHRTAATRHESDLLGRCQGKLLRQVLAAVEAGEV